MGLGSKPCTLNQDYHPTLQENEIQMVLCWKAPSIQFLGLHTYYKFYAPRCTHFNVGV
jgi:hypothetical protein